MISHFVRHAARGAGRIALLWIALARPAAAQEDFYHPELEWKTIETPHFLVHFHEGAERTGRTVAKIAEEIYEPVTSLYNHVPTEKVSFIIKDYDDISNGAAYFFDNKVEICAPSMDFDFRGTHDWLRNVVTHEFTHIVQIQTSMKFGRRLPAFYFQWLGYESERRPDVLYGYPNIIVSYPISGFVVPAWFAEGVAQYNRTDLQYDFWDSHRDMILRSYALDSNMLSWEEMGVFGKTSLGNESSYNSGFAFVSYIARTYGEDKLAEISRNLSTLTEVTIGGAIGRALGKSGEQVYKEWRSAVTAEYAERIAKVRTHLRQGEMVRFDSTEEIADPRELQRIETMNSPPLNERRPGAQQDQCGFFDAATGFANLYPTYSPDGTKVAYVSTKGGDYFSLSALYVYDLATNKETLIKPGVRTAVAWSPDGQKLYYAKNTRDNPHWSLQFDVYSYDIASRRESRITHGRRALSPTVSPDGTHIAYVVNSDGTTNLAVANADGSGERVITPYQSGEQVYNPKWSPSGDRIIFDYSLKDGRSIAEIRPDGEGLRFLISGDDDSRTGTFSSDGKSMLYSSDRTGIFNLYAYDFATGTSQQVTNVVGGAFCPTWNSSGDIVYSGYTSAGYKIFMMKNPGVIPDGDHAYVRLARGVAPGTSQAPVRITTPQFDWMRLRTYDDTNVPVPPERDYKSTFTSVSFVPFLRIDNYTYSSQRSSPADVIKPGVYLFSNDVLEKTGFFAGAAINRNFERDLFLQFFYRSKIPLLYSLGLEPVASAEIYNVTRKTSSSISLPDVPYIPVQVEYDLLEFDFALSQPILSQYGNAELRYAHSRYTSILQDFINPETNSLAIGSSDLYLIANTITLKFTLDATVPSRTEDINPVGRRLSFAIGRELNKFNGDGQYEETPSGLRPIYKPVNFTRLQGTWREFIPLFFRDNTLTATLNGEAIIGPPVDEFFDFYAGGLTGMKGYPFYSISGNRGVTAGLTYRFPISNNLDFRLLPIYFDKLYLAAYGDVGNTWTDNASTLGGWVSDAGVELRLESWSFYSYPTRFFFNASYGFNEFDRFIRSENAFVTYGKQVRLYFGVLFGFDFD